MKIIFMGTPDFSVGTLEALVEAGHDVCLTVTQPDKPKGRGKEMQFTPVKEAALRLADGRRTGHRRYAFENGSGDHSGGDRREPP